MAKKKRYQINRQAFEYDDTNPDKGFLMLYNQILMNDNFLSMTSSSQMLLIYLKSWATKNADKFIDPDKYNELQANKQTEHPELVVYSYSLANKIFKDNKTFNLSICELMYYGFLKTPKEITENGLFDNYKTNQKGELLRDKDGRPIEKDISDYLKKPKTDKSNPKKNSNAKVYYFSDRWYKEIMEPKTKQEIKKLIEGTDNSDI